MKKIYFFFLLLASTFGLNAQTLTPVVISTTGGYASNANGSYSYTVGEMTMVQTFTAGNNILTQGFQQPTAFPLGLLDLAQDAFGSFAAYPIPAVDHLWFGYELPESGSVSISLFDLLGQKLADVYKGNYENGKTTGNVTVSQFSAGVYFLTMTFTSTVDGKTHISSKKIQLIN